MAMLIFYTFAILGGTYLSVNDVIQEKFLHAIFWTSVTIVNVIAFEHYFTLYFLS